MKRVSNHDARAYIARREEFQSNTGNFRGEEHTPGTYVYTASLPSAYAVRGRVVDADYIVYSYSTPLAWHLPDGWVIPDVSYSITTSSKHHPNLPFNQPRSEADLPPVTNLGPTSARILRAIRCGYTMNAATFRHATLQAVVDTGEARWVDHNHTAIEPTFS